MRLKLCFNCGKPEHIDWLNHKEPRGQIRRILTNHSSKKALSRVGKDENANDVRVIDELPMK